MLRGEKIPMKHKLLLEIPEILETDRLVLRRYRKGDGKDFFDLFERNGNREFLKEAVSETATVTTPEEAEIRTRKHAVEWEARERFVIGIWTKQAQQYVGELWIEPKKWEVPMLELGYFLDSGYLGRGIATEAAKCALRFLFDDLHAHKVTIVTRDTNERSWKAAERLGFLREGHLRECSTRNGTRWGLYHYGMLASEYKGG
jgi:RimJ/RimL family protein N-acetyltransferase